MDQISAPAGRVQSPQEDQEGSSAARNQQKQHQTPDALDAHDTHDTRMGSPQTDREAGDNLNSAAASPSRSPAVVQTTTPKFGPSSAPSSPSSRPGSPGSPGSLATTAVASPGRPRDLWSVSRTQNLESSTMNLLVVLAKLAAFTVCPHPDNSRCSCAVDC